jgi:NADPH-dependent ferric siderophore reductase
MGPLTAQVTGAELITPGLRRVHLACPELAPAGAVATAAWVRAYFPLGAPGPPPPGGNREFEGMAARAYTIVGLDAAAGAFGLDFVLHGQGPGARWGARAAPGDSLRLVGPLGRDRIEARHRRYLLAGDSAALPAITQWLAAIPAGAQVAVRIWVAGRQERQDLGPADAASQPPLRQVAWHDLGGPTLADLAEQGRLAPAGWHPAAPDTKFFLAGEAGQVTRARRALVAAGRPGAGNLRACGYWRLGQAGDPGILAAT